MKGKYLLIFLACLFIIKAKGQTVADSVIIKVHPSYNDVSGIHRWLFGENYRVDWAMPVKLPLIHLSQFKGGLMPMRQGGGMESKSLRLEQKDGTEWVLRSVEKTPDKLLPDNLQGTFAVDWIGDEFSGQHPYSALIVPPLAEAARVPHANPIIGVVADDPALGEYRKIFAGMICLLEEREPAGNSDNTIKMDKELVKSYDSRVDGETFLRARLLDLLIGDWDRHEDQWRWAVKKNGKERLYTPVPRDRDQVFHVNQGLLPYIAARSWLDPQLDHFDGPIPRVEYSIFKTRFMRAFPDAQMSYERWMQITDDFVKAETDEVLEAGLRRLPKESYALRHTELLNKLKHRRNNIPVAMSEYYTFINRIVDIRATDKNERVSISDAPGKAMRVVIEKLNKGGLPNGKLLDMVYQPDITKEIRLYLQGGNDQVIVNVGASPIKLRVVDSAGQKTFDMGQANKTIKIYGQKDSTHMIGNTNHTRTYLANDTLNGRFAPVNLYNVWMPLATAGLNADDGFLLGLGFKYTGKDGFRKGPYSTIQQFMITHSFATDAFRIKYMGEWIQAIGKADLTAEALVQAPDNTMNFFGRGNNTGLDKAGDYRRFYRTRFDIYELSPALRWATGARSTFSAGPAFQFYHLDRPSNAGRFIETSQVNAYDAAIIDKDKAHLGLALNYISNHRDNNILPNKGFYMKVDMQVYTGLNSYSRGFMQVTPEFTYYQKLGSNIVISDRAGGGISIGSPAFYQSMFLGGQGNLLGYLQNRFAGQHMVYNNLQARLRLANIAGYILPGQLGLTGFYDTGRVWVSGEHSDTWHQGIGGGLYFSPAGLTVVQVLAGHSSEGWYPYISLNFRI